MEIQEDVSGVGGVGGWVAETRGSVDTDKSE